jgi:hypothetical protein
MCQGLFLLQAQRQPEFSQRLASLSMSEYDLPENYSHNVEKGRG